jgi:hypothetical protein
MGINARIITRINDGRNEGGAKLKKLKKPEKEYNEARKA